MEKKIKKKIKKSSKIIEYIITGVGAILFIIILLGMLSGSSIALVESDLLKYLITISFILAGFTFFTLIEEEKSKWEKKDWLKFWIGTSSWSFLMAGYFLLSFIFIPHIRAETFMTPIFDVLKESNTYIGLFGLLAFFLGSLSLLLSVYILRR